MRVSVRDVIDGPDGLTSRERYLKYERELRAKNGAPASNGADQDGEGTRQTSAARTIKYAGDRIRRGPGRVIKYPARRLGIDRAPINNGGKNPLSYAGGAR